MVRGAYVVFEAAPGHQDGVYDSKADAKRATKGHREARQKFRSIEEARRAWDRDELENPRRYYVAATGDAAGRRASDGCKFRSREEAQELLQSRRELPEETVQDYTV
jgi:hypothetical protein